MHPRTLKNIKTYGLKIKKQIKIIRPADFFNFSFLEINAFCVLTDSGTVQEECSILKFQILYLEKKQRDQRRLKQVLQLFHLIIPKMF